MFLCIYFGSIKLFATKFNVQWSQISRTIQIQQENKPIFSHFLLLQQF